MISLHHINLTVKELILLATDKRNGGVRLSFYNHDKASAVKEQ